MVEMLLGALVMLIGVILGYTISGTVKNNDNPFLNSNWHDISLMDTDHITLDKNTDHTTRHAAFGYYDCTLPRIHKGLCHPKAPETS